MIAGASSAAPAAFTYDFQLRKITWVVASVTGAFVGVGTVGSEALLVGSRQPGPTWFPYVAATSPGGALRPAPFADYPASGQLLDAYTGVGTRGVVVGQVNGSYLQLRALPP